MLSSPRGLGQTGCAAALAGQEGTGTRHVFSGTLSAGTAWVSPWGNASSNPAVALARGGARSLGDLSPRHDPAVAPPAASYLLLRFEDVAPEGVISAVPCDVTKYFQVLRVVRYVEDSRWERDKGN